MGKLIILRGNSGSGKTTVAKELQKKFGYNTMLISQDEIRRNILWVKDGIDTKALPLMIELLKYGYEHSDIVILEGIMYEEWYNPLFNKLWVCGRHHGTGRRRAGYGNLVARYRNAICFVMDNTHIYETMEPSMESEKFILTDKPHSTIRKEGFPLDSISLDIKTNKYYYDLPEDKLEQLAVEDGFLEFFKNILNLN